MDEKKRETFKGICGLVQKQNISFAKLAIDESKAGLIVQIVNTTLQLAKEVGSDFLWKGGLHYMYVGTHWVQVTSKELTLLLTTIARYGQIHEYKAMHHRFVDELYKQFRSIVRDMDTDSSEVVKINCANGTLVFDTNDVKLVAFDKKDNFCYKLSYPYDPSAVCPKFQRVLDDALPRDGQVVLQEYVASIFLSRFNHQKALLLFGQGGEGKSLIISVISAVLGNENVVERSIEGLCAEDSRTVADLEGKLLNICSEMSSRFNLTNFKQLVSKDPITARRLYGEPFTIYNYASLLFSCNELPRNIEYTQAYFRRLIILPFLNMIPEDQQDKALGDRIIKDELSGVLNWLIEGVNRLIIQGRFSKSEFVENALQDYRIDSDSVTSFITDNNYEKSAEDKDCFALKYLFKEYMDYCLESNCHACAVKTFSARVKNLGFKLVRRSQGMFVYAKKIAPDIIEATEVVSSISPEWA